MYVQEADSVQVVVLLVPLPIMPLPVVRSLAEQVSNDAYPFTRVPIHFRVSALYLTVDGELRSSL